MLVAVLLFAMNNCKNNNVPDAPSTEKEEEKKERQEEDKQEEEGEEEEEDPAPREDNFTLGVTKPNNTKTGIPAGTVLTPHYGDITITTAGQVVENLDIHGFVFVQAANVTIHRCRVRGSLPGPTGKQNWGLIDCNPASSGPNTLIENCLLVPDYPAVGINGILGHNYTVRRTETYNVVDGFGIYNTNGTPPTNPANVTIEGCYVHDLVYISPDPNHSDNRTHNDCIQIQGNSNISIVGNTLYANVSSMAGNGYPGAIPAPPANNPWYPSVTGQAIGVTPNVSQISSLTINKNWLDYGAQSITIVPNGKGVGSSVVVTGNHFGRNQPNLNKGGNSARRAIIVHPSVSVANFPTTTGTDTNCGNIYEDNNTPVTIWRMNP